MVTAVIEPQVSRQADGQKSKQSMIAAERDHEKVALNVSEFGPAPEGGT